MRALNQLNVTCDEAKLQQTISLSKEAFLAEESEQTISPVEFLYYQSKFIQKRWWILQGFLLAFIGLLLRHMETDFLIRRALGLSGPLFIILIIPELWKNRSFDAMEVECTTVYTLRSIYAARLTLFAGADIFILSIFFTATFFFTKVTLWEMMIQFILPFNVTCCICFRTLYCKRICSEALAMLLCIIWTGLWSMVILNNAVYQAISVPAWILTLAASFLYMGFTLFRGREKWQQIMEVKPLWI